MHLCLILQVGVGALTFQEQRAHFAVWAIMKSPLMLGTDLNSISKDQLDMVSNSEVRLHCLPHKLTMDLLSVHFQCPS